MPPPLDPLIPPSSAWFGAADVPDGEEVMANLLGPVSSAESRQKRANLEMRDCFQIPHSLTKDVRHVLWPDTLPIFLLKVAVCFHFCPIS